LERMELGARKKKRCAGERREKDRTQQARKKEGWEEDSPEVRRVVGPKTKQANRGTGGQQVKMIGNGECGKE